MSYGTLAMTTPGAAPLALMPAARESQCVSSTKRRLLLALVLIAHGLALAVAFHMRVEGGVDQAPGLLQVSWLKDEHPAPPAEPEPTAKPKPLPMRVKRTAALPRRVKRILAIDAATPSPSASTTIVPEVNDPAPSRAEQAELVPMARAAASDRLPGAVQAPTAPSVDADYLSNPAPEYPPLSRQLREQGLVTLRVHVTAQGNADAVQLYRSSSFARLDKAAFDVVWIWRFVPARQGREDVAGWVIVPIRFILRS